MNKWPKTHRVLLNVMILVVLAAVGTHLFVLAPRIRRIRQSQELMEGKTGRLRKTGWPVDEERLRTLLAEMESQIDGSGTRPGLQRQADLVLGQCTAMFRPKIRELFGTQEDFINGVSRLDYQAEFNRLYQRLAAQEVYLSPEILNLGEDSSSAYTYQLVLHVWTVDMLCELALQNGLSVARDPRTTVEVEGSGRQPAARITVLPMVAYFLQPEHQRPFLLEFPVRLTLNGSLHQAVAFLRILNSEGNRFPVNHIQLRTRDPGESGFVTGRQVTVDAVELELEACAFLSLGIPDDES